MSITNGTQSSCREMGLCGVGSCVCGVQLVYCEGNGIVQLRPGASVAPSALCEFTARSIARFKAPRAIAFCDSVRRHPSGKPGYPWERCRRRPGYRGDGVGLIRTRATKDRSSSGLRSVEAGPAKVPAPTPHLYAQVVRVFRRRSLQPRHGGSSRDPRRWCYPRLAWSRPHR